MQARRYLWMGAAAVLATAGCADPLDTTRVSVDELSFGTTVYTLACKKVAWTADRESSAPTHDVSGQTYDSFCRSGSPTPASPFPTVLALAGERTRLIPAMDSAFPADQLDAVQGVLASNGFLSAYDDGTAERAAGKLAAVFGVLAADPDFPAAMARLEGRLGYRPLLAQRGAVPAVASYPGLSNLLLRLPDAIGTGGPAHDEWGHLIAAVSKELIDTSIPSAPQRSAADRTLKLAVGLFLSESPLLGTGQPHWLVKRDARGLALVQPGAGNVLPAPFVDKNADGLADADADGHFVDTNGNPITPPTPFAVPWQTDGAARRDAAGRALTQAGAQVYQYVDLDRTLLAAVARDTPQLLDPLKGTGLNLLRGAGTILGRRQAVTATYRDGSTLTYRGFDPATASLLDVAYGYLNVLNDPVMDDALALLKSLAVDHENEAAHLMEALLATADLGKSFPAAQLTPGSPLYDDLIPIMNQILAEPGMAEALLRALEDPAVRPLAQRFRDFMYYKDQIDYNPDTQALVGTMHTPVDRAQADSGFNRSLMQRLLHLIHDSDGLQLCNKEGALISVFGFPISLPQSRCALLRVDDMAVFYLQSIAYLKDSNGNVVTDNKGPVRKANLNLNLPFYLSGISDDLLETSAGINGFRRHPTPEALNRVLLLNPAPSFIASTMDPVACTDGDLFIQQHTGTLQAFELNGFYDQLRPIVQVFADHGKEKLFVQILSVLHTHWPSTQSLQHQRTNPAGHGYAKESNAQSYEPLIIQVVDDGLLWQALTEGASVVNQVTAPSGKKAPEVLAGAARMVFAPKAGVKERDGRTTTTTEDGRPVATLSPWYVLADAYKVKRAQIAAAGAEGQLWQDSVSQLLDVLARGQKTGSTWHFKNARFRGVSAAVVDFLRARLTAHRTAGDLDAWLHVDMPSRMQQILTGPVFAGAADFVLALSAAPEARAALEGLGSYINSDGSDAFAQSITVAADLMQWFADDPDLVPIARVAGRALDPSIGALDAQVDLLGRARHADTNDALADLLRRLEGEYVPGRSPLIEVDSVVSEVHRQRPMVDFGKPMAAADYVKAFQAVGGFLSDEKRGLVKFIHIVENRHLLP